MNRNHGLFVTVTNTAVIVARSKVILIEIHLLVSLRQTSQNGLLSQVDIRLSIGGKG